MEKAGVQSSANILFMSDLPDLLKQTDRYSAVAVNPFTGHDIVMPMEVFLNLFYEPTEEEKEFFEFNNLNLILQKSSWGLPEAAYLIKTGWNIA